MGRVVRLIRRTTNIGFSLSPRWPWFQWDVWQDEWDTADDLTSRGVCISISRPVAAPRPSAQRPRPAQPGQRPHPMQAAQGPRPMQPALRPAQLSVPSGAPQRSNDPRRASLTTELASDLETFVRQLNAADVRTGMQKVNQNPPAAQADQKTDLVSESKTPQRRSGAQPATKRARPKRRQAEREFTP